MSKISINIVDDNGEQTYGKGMEIAPGGLEELRNVCTEHLKKHWLGYPNPDYDLERPESDENPTALFYDGDDAIAYVVRVHLVGLMVEARKESNRRLAETQNAEIESAIVGMAAVVDD